MTTQDALRQFILDDIIRQPTMELSATERLIDRGYLTSLDVVNLLGFIEERLGVMIDPDDVTEEHFQTLESITALVERQAQSVG